MGIFENQKREVLEKAMKQYKRQSKNVFQSLDDWPDLKKWGIETTNEIKDRVVKAYNYVIDQSLLHLDSEDGDLNVLVVSHGHFLCGLLGYMSSKLSNPFDFYQIVLKNTSLTRCSVHINENGSHDVSLLNMNDDSHISDSSISSLNKTGEI
jgi:broad specificity phosphatase PhoE